MKGVDAPKLENENPAVPEVEGVGDRKPENENPVVLKMEGVDAPELENENPVVIDVREGMEDVCGLTVADHCPWAPTLCLDAAIAAGLQPNPHGFTPGSNPTF